MTPRSFHFGNSREKLHRILSTLANLLIKPEDDWDLILSPHKRNKTHEQRKLFHALCAEVGKELGYSPGQVKEMVKEDYFGRDEIVTPSGKRYSVVKSSEDADRMEYSELIDHLIMWSAQNGFAVEDRRAA